MWVSTVPIMEMWKMIAKQTLQLAEFVADELYPPVWINVFPHGAGGER